MAGYSRQSTADITASAVVKAAPINDEFNNILAAFAFSGGHNHDGTSTEGAYVGLIADVDALNKVVVDTSNNRVGFFTEVSSSAVEQIRIQDGAILPVTDNDIDLGASGTEFKDLYIDGTAHIDTLDVDANATIAGTLDVTGAMGLSGAISFADGSASAPSITNTGDTNCGLFFSAADTLAFTAGGTAQFTMADGVIAPVTDSDVDLGTSSLEFKDLYLDGTAHIDTLDVDVNATVAGTLGVTGAITGSSTVQGTTITATTAFVPDANDGAALGTTSLEFSDLFLADGAVINLGNDQDVTLTHVADTGILLNSTNKIQFNDASQFIHGSSATVLSLGATDEIDLTATAIDINGTADISGNTAVGGTLAVTGVISPTTHVDMPDSANVKLGTGDDMQLYHDGSNSYITNATGALKLATETSGIAVTIGHGTSEVTIGDNLTVTGNLTVSGTQTVVDTVTMNAQNAIVFEGATADSNETTLSIVDPTSDHTQYLINQGGYIPVLAAVTTTAITSTPAELNLLDGVTATTAELNILDGVTSTAAELSIVDGDTSASTVTLVDADRVVVNDNGTMKQVALSTLNTYIGGSTTGVGALNSGSITSGFGSIDNGSSAITTTGTVTYGSLSDGTITITAFVDEDDLSSDSATLVPTQQSVKAYVDANKNVSGLTATGAEINVVADGDTSVGTTAVAGGDGIPTNDSGTMRLTSVDTFDTYLAGTTKTLTNKTLTAPKFADGGFIADANGNELIMLQTASSAVNQLEVTNSATGGSVVVGASGDDSNIDIDISPKGTGEVNIAAGNLNYAGTAVTSTGAELNILDGVTAEASELNLVDGSGAGTIVNSKAVVYGSSGEVNATTLQIAGTSITATAAELNYVDGVTSAIQTQLAAKATVDDATALAIALG